MKNFKNTDVHDLFQQAKAGTLPLDFTDWDLINEQGQTIAEVAIQHGVIPKDYDLNLLYNNRYTFAHVLARIGKLPKGFNGWHLKDVLGWTVAHEAAVYGNLPEDIGTEVLLILDGDEHVSVARIAARYGNLSKDFPGWDMTDGNGDTIAHESARYGTLPQGLPEWVYALTDESGYSVGFLAAMCGTLPDDFIYWDLANDEGRTIAHEAACYGNLPENFPFYNLVDNNGWTVAHEVVASGFQLPDDFIQWDISDESGTTVEHVAARFGKLP